MIAALFVARGGCYYGLPDVDPWDEERDARRYAGPWPVVAHPPCERWGRYWGGGPMLARTPRQKKLGDDNGCFASALSALRVFGGVIEHPEASHAWGAHHIVRPPRSGGWVSAGIVGGWTCCVEQGHYGHRARKATWLYAIGVTDLPELKWGPSPQRIRLDDGFHSAEERRKAVRSGQLARLSKRESAATPPQFRDILLSIASRPEDSD
ncbi:MAG: hypothetical protein M3O61_18615 [Gemmatimonadota bacterium]|nr:hypothetical protein [Gemmatimonadota bacterium]